MTPDEFICWIKGFIEGLYYIDNDRKIVDILLEAVKSIKAPVQKDTYE